MIKRVIIGFVAVLLLTLATTGCNTVRGAGKDVENVGEEMQEATPP